jgi:tetratricopeptide (TPR) repeat protein
MDAIEQRGEKITGELPKGSRVAIVAFESVSDNLSDYIMEELTGALFDRGIEVADRQNLEYVYKELNLQMGGDVSDESAKSIGKFLAADMVITGQLLDLDGMYRYRTSAINVETAVRASVTRLDVRSDQATRRMVTALANQKTSVKAAKYGVNEQTVPQSAGTFLDRGIMFASRGEYDLAIADFTEAIKLNPNSVTAYNNRGYSYYMMNNYDLAIADFNQAINLDINYAISYHNRGSIYDSKGDYDRAITDFNQAIRLEPNKAISYSGRGLAYSNKGEQDKAITDLNRAIQLDPNFAMAYHNRAFAYFGKGNHDQVIADTSQSIRLDPNYAPAYFLRGISYSLGMNDYNRAITDFEAATRIDPNDVGIKEVLSETLFKRAFDYIKRGDFDRTIVDLNEAIRLNPNYVLAYFARGTAYVNKGDFDRAITNFETVIRLDPNNSTARQSLESARQQLGR